MELRYYPAHQVLAWWRSYAHCKRPETVERDAGRIGPEGYHEHALIADLVSSEIRIDRRYLAYLHVELFFEQNFEWHHCHGHLLMGEPSPVDDVWDRWYAANPIMITADVVKETGTVFCPEFQCLLLGEALAIWNDSAKPKDQRSITAARTAAAEHRLDTWKPAGRIMTTVNEIRRWVASDSRKNGDSGNSAA